MPITISIITVTYRDPVGFRRTIESLFPLYAARIDWEHIIVDSSPTENRDILAMLPQDWPLRYVTEEPRGIYTAMNSGLERARGVWVWFLNGGDRLRNVSALRSLLDSAEASRADLCGGAADLYRDGAFLYTHWSPRGLLPGLIGTNRICHQSVLYRSAFLKTISPFSTELRLAGDYDHHFRCMIAGSKWISSCERIVDYDMEGSSAAYRKVFAEFKKVHRKLRPYLRFWINLSNEVVRPLEYAKVEFLKTMAKSPAAEVLRPLWLAWNRRRRFYNGH